MTSAAFRKTRDTMPPDGGGTFPVSDTLDVVAYVLQHFKPSPETEAAVREVMIAAGVTPPKIVVAKTQQIY